MKNLYIYIYSFKERDVKERRDGDHNGEPLLVVSLRALTLNNHH